MIEYRKADPNDIDELAELRVAMLCDDAGCAAGFREKLRANTGQYMHRGFADGSFIAWIASVDGRIVAMSGLTFFTLPPNDWCPDGRTAYIGNMYTQPEYRGQGMATRLLALAVDEAKERGCDRIMLHATDMGRPIYEKFGFEPSPAAMAYYPYRRG